MQEGGTAQFEVTLRPASEQTVTVNFETADGTAKAATLGLHRDIGDADFHSGATRRRMGRLHRAIGDADVSQPGRHDEDDLGVDGG